MEIIELDGYVSGGTLLKFNGQLFEVSQYSSISRPWGSSTLHLNLTEVDRAELRSRLVTARDAAQAAFEVADDERAAKRDARNAACTALTDFDRAT